jgi:HEAT repeat protein
MNCEQTIKLLPLMQYGELSFDEEEHVQQHLDTCDGCRRELTKLRALHEALDNHEPDVEALLLARCRRQLRTTVQNIEHVAPARRRGFLSFLPDFRSAFSPAWLKPVGALALLTAGFFSGRYIPTTDQPIRTLRAPENVVSRVRYVEPNASGQVRIVVEETSQRTLSGDPDDESIRRLLLAAAREASDPGLRVESVDLLRSQAGSVDVRRALVYALQHDPNPGVRFKALEGLRGFAQDPETRKTLAEVLLNDDNPGVRTQAIDLLIQKKEPSMVGVLQELVTKEDNNYVRMRCQKALHEMNASVETF